MVKFGVIGTSVISKQFINAVSKSEEMEVRGIYSRTKEKGKKIVEEYNIGKVYTDLEEFFNDEEIDAIYIASPNSLHCEQSIAAMKKGKNVLCEKPLASNVKEIEEMIKVSKENNVTFMEAMMTTFTPNFDVIKENLSRIGKVRKIYVNFSKVSSKYNDYLKGNLPNIFNPKFSTGATMDLGVYTLYPLLNIFGKPKKIDSRLSLLPTGVDGEGNIILDYNDFSAYLSYSKISTSYIPCEIQGESGSIVVDGWSIMNKVTLYLNNGVREELTLEQDKNPMYYEIQEFKKLVLNKEKESKINTHYLSLEVGKILEKVRKENNIIFPGDK